MTFTDSIKTCLSKYATFSGRAELSEFWWFFLFQIFTGIVLSLTLPESIANIVMLFLFLPSLAVGTRRLHDSGMSGWWQLLLLTGIGVFVLVFFWAQDTNHSKAHLYNE